MEIFIGYHIITENNPSIFFTIIHIISSFVDSQIRDSGWPWRIEDVFQHKTFNKTFCSGLESFWIWEGIFIIFCCGCLFNVAFISFSFLCCAYSVTLSCLCLGWWPKEPAGLKTLRLVSMPSWRHTNSEEQEEEDDDDVVGPLSNASVPAGTAGPSESLRFSRSPGAWLPIASSLSTWEFGSQRTWLKLIAPLATVR